MNDVGRIWVGDGGGSEWMSASLGGAHSLRADGQSVSLKMPTDCRVRRGRYVFGGRRPALLHEDRGVR